LAGSGSRPPGSSNLNRLQVFHKRRKRDAAADAARRRKEQERHELELSISHSHLARLVEILEAQAGAWLRATLLRRYLRVLRRVAGEGQIAGTLGDQKVDFLLWAEQYVNQLNPCYPAPRVPEMLPGSRCSYRSNTEMQSQLARLLGGHWHGSMKVATTD
jgi:hypothetical protein